MQFKVGDRVRFKAGERAKIYIKPGEIATVIAVGFLDGEPAIRTDIVAERNPAHTGYYAKRFELVEAAKPAVADNAIIEFKPGDKVLVDKDALINKRDLPAIPLDKVCTVKSGKQWITLVEYPGVRFHSKRFKLHKAAEPKKEELNLREELTKLVKQKGQFTICSYGTQYEDGTMRKQVNDICHARLTERPYNLAQKHKLTAAALILCGSDQIMERNVNDAKQLPKFMQVYEDYLRYILNESPWSVAFLTKDVKEAMEKGVLLNIDVHRNWCVGAAVATREGVEFPGRLPVFHRVRQMGFSGNVAYLCSMYLAASSFEDTEYYTGDCNGGHQVLAGQAEWNAIKLFMANGYKTFDRPSFREEQGGYHILTSCLEGYGNKKLGAWDWREGNEKKQLIGVFKDNCPMKVEGEGWMAKRTIDEASLKQLATFIDNELKGAKQ